MRLAYCVLALGAVAATLAPLSAHHSFAAEFDRTKPVQLTGAVTRVEWNNPHVYFYIDVENAETGRIDNWSWEMGAPAVLQRSGWKKSNS